MEKRILDGDYSEESLQKMLHNGEIDHLTYVFHHSEERRAAFISFCSERGLNKDEKAAQQFVEYQLNKEVEMHSDLLD